MEVEMKIRGLMMDPVTNMPIVILKDIGSDTVLPIWVGVYEANAIALEIEKVTTPRPMTHDLIKNVLVGLESQVHKVVVTELREDTFYAVIWLEREGHVGPAGRLPHLRRRRGSENLEAGRKPLRSRHLRRAPQMAGRPERRRPRPLQNVRSELLSSGY